MRIILLSLRYVNDKPILNFDLTGKLTDFTIHNSDKLEIHLPTGTIYLDKWQYLNKWKIYEDPKNPKCFFIVCNKQANQDYAFKFLMEYAISKIDKVADDLSSRLDNLHTMKVKLQKSLIAA
jgi:hypothetical protein